MESDPRADAVALPDGAQLVVRPIRPEDAEALVALHSRLTADSIYRRYFGARPHLSPADVHRFTRVDGRARFALVALRAADLVAVARYEGQSGQSSAELAVVVDDALQHQGVGRLMLGRLLDIARETGLETIVADVLSGNDAMLRLLRGLDLPQRWDIDGDVVTIAIDLTALKLPADRRDRARQHLLRAASNSAPTAG